MQKYGEEVTRKLITQQKEYEALKKDNDCEYCGKSNEGTIVEWGEGQDSIIRYELWSNGRCELCGRKE